MKIRVLLIEDDAEHCQEYIDFNIEQGKPFALDISYGCSEGLSLLESFQPDVVLLDLMLNKSDGSGIAFLSKLKRLSLLKRPQIIVITSILTYEMHEKVLERGVDFIITKDKVDYSPKFVFNLINDICSGGKKTKCKFNSEETLKATITEMIERLGITHGMDGWEYLIDAVILACKSKSKVLAHDVYPVLAKKYGKSVQAIEKAIRTAINKAWRNTDICVLNKYYTPQTSFVSGAPSVKELVYFLVDKIKA